MKQLSIIVIIIGILLLPKFIWLFKESSVLDVAVIDKTVPKKDYREHKGIFMVLDNKKITKENGEFYDIGGDYYGYDPYEQAALPSYKKESSPDLIYVADTYGVYSNDLDDIPDGERSEKIYGGMELLEWIIIVSGVSGLVVIGLVLYLGVANKMDKERNRATWIWHAHQIVEEPSALLSFLQEQQIDTIYLQINPHISNEQYAQFIGKATVLNIAVQALHGAPEWIHERDEVETFFQWLTAYQDEVPEAAQFTAIHLDVEPYLLSEWKDNYASAVFHFQHFIRFAKEHSTQLHLPLEMDIPWDN